MTPSRRKPLLLALAVLLAAGAGALIAQLLNLRAAASRYVRRPYDKPTTEE